MNFRRLGVVAHDELSLTLRRPMVWTLIVLLFLMSWGLSEGVVGIIIGSGDATVGGKKAFLTSEFAITQVMTVFTFVIYTFFLAAAAGLSVIRDEEARILELLHATPLRPAEYGWGKFIGVASAFAVVLILNLVFLVFFLAVVPNADMIETRGPFVLGNYLRPLVVFALPTLLFFGGVSFGIGTATRRPVLVFVLPIALSIFCGVFLWSWSPGWLTEPVNRVLMFLDPGGVRWLRETWLAVDRGAEFYNTQRVALDPLIVANRLFWATVGVSVAALGVLHHARRARVAHRLTPEQVSSALAGASRPQAMEPILAPATPLASLGMRSGALGFGATAWAAARAEGRELASRAGLYLFIPLIIAQLVGGAFTALGAFDTPLLLTPGQLATTMMQAMAFYVTLLLVFYGVESMERERAARLDAIQDAYPLRTGALLAGKLLALGVVWLVIAIAGAIAAGIIVAVQGRVAFSVTPFALMWGILFLPTFLAFASFVFAAWSVAGSRYTTYALALLAFGVTVWADLTQRLDWVTNWLLVSGVSWSDMATLEFDRGALVLNRLFWLSMAGLFWAIAVRWYPRRARDPIHFLRLPTPMQALRAFGGAAPVLVLPLVLGGFLWSRVDAGPDGARAEKAGKDYWKKNIATWKDASFPWLAAADVAVDIDPPARSWRVRGSYLVRNQRDTTLRTLAVTVGLWRDMRWTVNGDSIVPDTASHLYVFRLKEPLGAGDSLRLAFSYSGDVSAPTERGGGAAEFIVPSGVVMTSFGPRWFPLLGYVESIGVDDDNRYEPRQYPDDWYEGTTPPLFGSALPMTVRTEITVPADFTANGVGEKVSERVDGDRRIVTWKSDEPVMAFNIIAGRLAEKRGEGTALYYHPEHSYNVEEMLDAMNASRQWFGEWFGEYPWKTLKVSEFPALATYAQGFPTNISFSENIGFLTKSEPKTNLAFLVTAHESAHQWWGNMLQPGNGPGANILSEGMAHFSTALLIEQVKGTRNALEFRKRIETRYGENRRADAERKLYRIDGSKDGDNTVTYDKGGWVFWMLADRMGRADALRGMHDFIAKFRGGEDHAALEDLTTHLRGYARDTVGYDDFVRQWFDTVVVAEYRVERAQVRRLPEGEGWETEVVVRNAGSARMPLDVAVVRGERFPEDSADTKGKAYAQAIARATPAVGASDTLRIRSPFEPEKAVVDPDVRVLQLRRALAELKVTQ